MPETKTFTAKPSQFRKGDVVIGKVVESIDVKRTYTYVTYVDGDTGRYPSEGNEWTVTREVATEEEITQARNDQTRVYFRSQISRANDRVEEEKELLINNLDMMDAAYHVGYWERLAAAQTVALLWRKVAGILDAGRGAVDILDAVSHVYDETLSKFLAYGLRLTSVSTSEGRNYADRVSNETTRQWLLDVGFRIGKDKLI